VKIVLGGGLAGLTAAYTLARSGEKVTLLERDGSVGGLARTVNRNGFKFDLGGHRFLTHDREIEMLVRDILEKECLDVSRKSSIFLLGKYFDYPLKPFNAVFGVGFNTSLRIIHDYITERIRGVLSPADIVSLEDWVVNRFGRSMFDLYFKQYSEKVWGIDCGNISQEWVAQRIKGLSLWEVIKNACFRFGGKRIDTLADGFLYPSLGIGEISHSLRRYLEREHPVMTGTKVRKIVHENGMVRRVTVENGDGIYHVEGNGFISTIPLTNLIRMLEPAPPDDVIEASLNLHFRDLVVVTLMLDRARVTDLTWLYLPERTIPIGRVHEPKNWSPLMAPKGKTSIVAEYFCFRGDRTWTTSPHELTDITVNHLEKLGFFERKEVSDSCVVPVPKAYPLLDTQYSKHYERVIAWLDRFTNLRLAGRGGMFRYLNMDHAMRSGIDAAKGMLDERSLHCDWNREPAGANP